MIAEQSRHQKKMMAIERGKRRIKQRLSDIDWEHDYLRPKVAEFLGKAQLPELPSEYVVDVEWEVDGAKDVTPPKVKAK